MPTQRYQPIIVIGINDGEGDQEIVKAHSFAKELFEEDLVLEKFGA